MSKNIVRQNARYLIESDQDFRRKLIYRDSELGVMLFLLKQQLSFADDALELLRKQ